MGLYSQLNSADDRTGDIAPSAVAGSSEQPTAIPQESSPTRHRQSRSIHSIKHHTTDTEEEDDGAGWEFDDEEGIELMPTSGSRQKIADEETDVEGEGRHVDEDEDINAPSSMVRRIVPEYDNPEESALCPLVMILGTILCVVASSISQLFFFKSNAPSFSSFFIILISYPLGKIFAKFMPDSLHSGPFTKKNHALVAILVSSGSSAAYGGEIISVQSLFYKYELSTIAGLLLLLTTQLIGFGLSGLTYRLLVRPTAMVWPYTLVIVSLFGTLHGTARASVQDTKDRMRFFSIASSSAFVWQFLPAVWFPGLSSIAVLCLINNRNWILTTLGSGYEGFGWLSLSADWSVIGGTGALYTPWPAALCFYAGLFLNTYILTPFLYFSNWWSSLEFHDSPVSAHLFNSTLGRLNVRELLNPDLSLNETNLELVGPIRLTPYFAMSYGISFAVLTSAIVSVLLWDWDTIKDAFSAKESGDIHVEMLERCYDPVPKSYYATVFFSCLFGAMILLWIEPALQLPFWGLLLAIALACVFLVPIGVIAAVTNTTLGLNVITEFVAGFIWPGQPIANILFKVYGYMTMVQSLDLTGDLKLGLYLKLAPKHLFLVQVYGTALGSIVNCLLIKTVIASKRPYLDGTIIDPTGQWSGRKPEIFFSASVIWGLIAPARFFSAPGYGWLYLGFPIGAVLPLIPWYFHRRAVRSGDVKSTFWKQVSIPLILHGSIIAPQAPLNLTLPGFAAAFWSQWYLPRFNPAFFDKYLFVLSSALDAGTSINALVVYLFGLGTFVEWWGNSYIDTEHCRAGS